MTFFSKVFRHKDDSSKKTKHARRSSTEQRSAPVRPHFVSTWESTHIEPDEVEELLHSCTLEIKSRAEALDTPFLLLPFRPEYDSASSKSFIRAFYAANREGRPDYRGGALQQELRLSTAEVLCSIVKWCWARLPGGVVTWSIYELFRLGESESGMLRTAFDTFIPLSAPSESAKNIIYDFFDLLAAIAAHGKVNGLTGSKLSRLAGWWAFEQPEDSVGFETGYRHWASAAEATSHLFFAYLRSRAPEDLDGTKGISSLPRSLQSLLAQTEYPPQLPALMQSPTHKVVMIVEHVSPDPFTLLRRANNFEFRAQDKALQQFADCLDPIQALTEECKRVLQAIAAANQSPSATNIASNASSLQLSGFGTGGDDGWSRFQDVGFSSLSSNMAIKSSERTTIPLVRSTSGLQTFGPQPPSGDKARPTTPSWADFLSEKPRAPPTFLPASKSLPALHGGPERLDSAHSLAGDLEPGELASTTQFKLDEAFWWVWMTSLAGEEPARRKAAFGRCALIETHITDGRWLVMEEQLKGATAGPEEGAYIAEKKHRFGFSRRKGSTRKKDADRPAPLLGKQLESSTPNKSIPTSPSGNVSFDQQLMIKAAAVELARKTRGDNMDSGYNGRRGRHDDASSVKTNSMLTIGGMKDVQPALKWAQYQDKEAIRKQYLGSNFSVPDSVSEQDSDHDQTEMNKELPTLPPSHTSQGNTPPQLESQLLVAQQIPLPAATPREGISHPASVHEVTAPVETDENGPSSPVDSASNPSTFARNMAVGTGPIDSPDRRSVHPALRDDLPNSTAGEQAAQIGARTAWQSVPESPSKRPDRAKLTKPKNSGHGGLRKMFSRSKRQNAGRSSEDSNRSTNTLELTRSISVLQKESSGSKEEPVSSEAPRPVTPPPVGATVPQQLLPPNVKVSPVGVSGVPQQDFAEMPSSPVDTLDQKEANEHFARFDQGLAVSSPERSSVETPRAATIAQPIGVESSASEIDYMSRPQQMNREESVYVTPMDTTEALNEAHPISAITEEEESPVKASPALSQSERWAAIRRNVAVRTNTQENKQPPSLEVSQQNSPRVEDASKESLHTITTAEDASEDKARQEVAIQPPPPKSPKTPQDEGETSGEESIEDRVARIKARVAHLTAGQPKKSPPRENRPEPVRNSEPEADKSVDLGASAASVPATSEKAPQESMSSSNQTPAPSKPPQGVVVPSSENIKARIAHLTAGQSKKSPPAAEKPFRTSPPKRSPPKPMAAAAAIAAVAAVPKEPSQAPGPAPVSAPVSVPTHEA